MAARAEAVEDDPRPIHAIALCLGSAGWRECAPANTPEVKQRFALLAAKSRLGMYEEVHDEHQSKVGDDVFIANLKGLELKDGRAVTYATWTKTVDTWLPKADYVAFVVIEGREGAEKGRVLGMAPWDRVMAVCGSHLKDIGRLPKYWATGTWFPNASELETLRLTDPL
jgi:hypothetical protein